MNTKQNQIIALRRTLNVRGKRNMLYGPSVELCMYVTCCKNIKPDSGVLFDSAKIADLFLKHKFLPDSHGMFLINKKRLQSLVLRNLNRIITSRSKVGF